VRIDVLLGESPTAPADVADRVVVVIDVLRAATTVAVALSNGASVVCPFASVDDTRRVAASMIVPALTAGEREMVRIPGFDLGNSPAEYSRAVVEGRMILFTTTNGTAALIATREARVSFLAAFVNVEATVTAVMETLLAERGLAGVLLVCSGTDRQVTLEDVVCAGRLARRLRETAGQTSMSLSLSDSARVAVLAEAPYAHSLEALRRDAMHARSLEAAGFGGDVQRCFSVDTTPVAVRFGDGALRPIGRVAGFARDLRAERVS